MGRRPRSQGPWGSSPEVLENVGRDLRSSICGEWVLWFLGCGSSAKWDDSLDWSSCSCHRPMVWWRLSCQQDLLTKDHGNLQMPWGRHVTIWTQVIMRKSWLIRIYYSHKSETIEIESVHLYMCLWNYCLNIQQMNVFGNLRVTPTNLSVNN